MKIIALTSKNPSRLIATGILGAGLTAALTLTSCSGSSPSTPTASPTTPAASSPSTPVPPAGNGVPSPPAGATQLTSRAGKAGGTFARYQIGESAAGVVSYYENALKASGFAITNSGGGGGGWGQYGGSGAGVEANKAGTFIAVEAGGSQQGPTYFEVCVGASAAQVSDCRNGDQGD
ncbi:MAG: hypothetical protein Q8P61_04160 [Candidatus Nanopelagicales bacterium]|nr:hypothetical protein [Candidatus Nanopelagicales bacterium]